MNEFSKCFLFIYYSYITKYLTTMLLKARKKHLWIESVIFSKTIKENQILTEFTQLDLSGGNVTASVSRNKKT